MQSLVMTPDTQANKRKSVGELDNSSKVNSPTKRKKNESAQNSKLLLEKNETTDTKSASSNSRTSTGSSNSCLLDSLINQGQKWKSSSCLPFHEDSGEHRPVYHDSDAKTEGRRVTPVSGVGSPPKLSHKAPVPPQTCTPAAERLERLRNKLADDLARKPINTDTTSYSSSTAPQNASSSSTSSSSNVRGELNIKGHTVPKSTKRARTFNNFSSSEMLVPAVKRRLVTPPVSRTDYASNKKAIQFDYGADKAKPSSTITSNIQGNNYSSPNIPYIESSCENAYTPASSRIIHETTASNSGFSSLPKTKCKTLAEDRLQRYRAQLSREQSKNSNELNTTHKLHLPPLMDPRKCREQQENTPLQLDREIKVEAPSEESDASLASYDAVPDHQGLSSDYTQFGVPLNASGDQEDRQSSKKFKTVSGELVEKWLQTCSGTKPSRNSSGIPTLDEGLPTDMDLEMDWEEIEDITNVANTKQTNISIKVENGWYIILDTNILLDHLKLAEELRDTFIPGYGLPIIVVPWRVLQELDGLKDNRKFKSGKFNVSKSLDLVTRARKAVRFLHNNMIKNHSRVRGQTAKEAATGEYLKNEIADDDILHCCYQFLEKGNSVIIVSDDKNFVTKALASEIQAYTMEGIFEAISTMSPVPTEEQVVSLVLPKLGARKSFQIQDQRQDLEAARADAVWCAWKSIFKEALSEVLVQEMKEIYGDKWLNVVKIKPPWVLADVISCVLNHFIAVFKDVFVPRSKEQLEKIMKFLKDASMKPYGYSLVEIQELLQKSVDIFVNLPNDKNNYCKMASSTVLKLEKVYEQVEDMQYEIQTNNFSLDYENSSVDTHQCPDVRQMIESKKSHSRIIKDSLISIWETVCNICCSVHDYLGLPHSKNSAEKLEFSSLMEIKKTVNNIYTRLHNLISCLQKTLAVPLNSFFEDIEEIKGLYLALISFNSEENMEDLLSPELVYKFCNLPKHSAVCAPAEDMASCAREAPVREKVESAHCVPAEGLEPQGCRSID
uniref:PIN domain-containing protein n=1 Tax=Timema poppense TaxID=170557 RepID=A0A7R9GWV7_TIMPO|nr:unnamed protein product [Timema poppensis]